MKDVGYQYIISGNLLQLLYHYQKINYVNYQMFDLLFRIFKFEKERINVHIIKQHPWLILKS